MPSMYDDRSSHGERNQTFQIRIFVDVRKYCEDIIFDTIGM